MPRLVLKAGSRPPWVGLAAAIWVLVAAGNAYNFPLYSPALKSVLGFSQQQITMLGVANDLGESFGLIPGIACNKLAPWALLAVGAAFCFVGYGVVWLAVGQMVAGLPYWLLWITLLIAANSNAWLGTAVLVTNMRNFPLSRGTVSGILKGYVGLAASVYTVLYNMVLGNSSTKLLLLQTLGIPILCLSMMYFVRPCTPASGEDSWEHGHFLFTQTTSILLAMYLLGATILSDVVSLSVAISYSLVAVMVVLMLSPLAIPLKMTLFPGKRVAGLRPSDSSGQLVSNEGELSDPLLTPSSSAAYLGNIENEEASDVETLLAVGEGAVKKKKRPRRGEDFNLREAFVKADFWLLWLAYFLGVGSGVTVLNNLAQIGIAFGVNDTTLLLALFSFCNFLGRLGAGAISEYFVRLHMLPRTVWMACSEIVMSLAFIPFAFGLDGFLYIATILLGLSYGTLYCSLVPTTSELFGLKHFGLIYTFMLLGNPIGAFIFSGFLAGFVYDNEAARQGSATCIGSDCYKLTFLILSGVCGLGTILTIILTIRIKPVYQMLYSGGSFRVPQNR